MSINSSRVNEILVDCLFKENEIIDGKPVVEPVVAEGVKGQFGFYPARLKGHTDEICEMIDQLPPAFKQVKGDSFLNLCMDKEGQQWTGMHQVCDELMMLGLATGKILMLMPRVLWGVCPGGLPMVRVMEEPFTSSPNYKDMSKYRHGRERSRVAQTWLSKYKDGFLELIRTKSGIGSLNYNLDEILLGSGYTAQIVVNAVQHWLLSETGMQFIQEAFQVQIPNEDPIQRKGRYAEYWMDQSGSFMGNVIYRIDNHDTVSNEVYEAVNQGSPETAEIVADTVIGWLNSPVGRSFVKKVFQASVPENDPEGSE